jgi:hypothetical protein
VRDRQATPGDLHLQITALCMSWRSADERAQRTHSLAEEILYLSKGSRGGTHNGTCFGQDAGFARRSISAKPRLTSLS